MGNFSFNSLVTYAAKWEATGREMLKDADPKGFKSIESAQVVEKEQDWGTSRSICFFLKGGGRKYIVLSRDSELEDGDEVDPSKVEITTLERDGDEPIYRADVVDTDDSDEDEDEEEEEKPAPKKSSRKRG